MDTLEIMPVVHILGHSWKVTSLPIVGFHLVVSAREREKNITLGLSKMELVLQIYPFGHVPTHMEGARSHLCNTLHTPIPQAAQI